MKSTRFAKMLSIGSLLAASQLTAQTVGTWNLNANGNWTTPATNWLSSVVPNGIGHTAIINRDINANRIITLDAPITLGALILGDQNATHAYTLIGSALTFNNAGHMARFNKSLGVSGDIISSNISLADNLMFNITTGGSFSTPANALTEPFKITGVISGSKDFTKLGAGNLTLAAANTLSGNFVVRSTGGTVFLNSPTGPAISSPVLQIGNSNRDGNSTATIQLPTSSTAAHIRNSAGVITTPAATTNTNQIADTTVVRYDASTATFGNRWGFLRLMGNAETVGGLQDTSREGIVENTGTETGIDANAIIGINTAVGTQYTFAGYLRDKSQQIDDPLSPSTGKLGVLKTGAGTQIFRGDRVQYSGPTTINGGKLVLSNITHFFTADANNSANPNERNLLPLIPQLDNITFSTSDLVPGQFPRLLTSEVNVASATAALELNATSLWTLGAPIKGTGEVIKTGGQRLIITNNNTDFTGTLRLSGGTLRLDSGVRTLELDGNSNYVKYDDSAGDNRNRLKALFGNGTFTNADKYIIESGELEIMNYANEVDPTTLNVTRVNNVTDTGSGKGRLSNTAEIISRGGLISFKHDQGDGDFTERVGGLQLESGVLNIRVDTAGIGRISQFSFNGLVRSPVGGVTNSSGINFIYNDNSYDDDPSTPASGQRLATDTSNQIINRGSTPTTNGIIGSWATVTYQKGQNLFDVDFATYSNNDVVVPYSNHTNPTSDTIGATLNPNDNFLIDNLNTKIVSTLYNNANKTIDINSLKLDESIGAFNVFNSNATPSLSDRNPIFKINSGGIISRGGNNQIISSQNSTTPISIQPGSVGNGSNVNEFNIWVVPGNSGSGTPSLVIQNTVTLDNNNSSYDNITNGGIDTVGNVSRLVKNGVGELRLLGINRYTGGTVINQGGIEISSVGALGDVTAGFNNANPMPDFLNINGGVLQITGNQTVFSSDKGVTLGVNGGTFGVGANATLVIQSPISGAGNLKMGGSNVQGSSSFGTLQLEGTNTFTGALNVDVGSVILAGGTNQFSSVIISGDELVVDESNAFTGNNLPGDLSRASVDFPNSGSNLASGSLVVREDLIIGALSSGGNSGGTVEGKSSEAGVAKLTIDQDANTTFRGEFADGGSGGKVLSLKKKGTGILTLSAFEGSSHTGGVEVEAGIIAFNRLNERIALGGTFSSLGLVSSTLADNLPTADLIKISNGAALSFIGEFSQTTNRPFTIGTGSEGVGIYANGTAGATISFKQGKLFDSSMTVIGDDAIAFSATNQKSTLNIGGLNTGNNEFQLKLTDNGTGALELVKTGTGKWILGDSSVVTPSSNSYTGATNIYAGTLAVAQNGVFGAANNGAVNLIGGNLDLNNVNYSSTKELVMQGGRLRALTGISNSWAGAVRMANASAVEVGPNASLNLAGAISGPSQLQKRGLGTLVLSGINSYSGGLSISEGTVQLDYTTNPGAKISSGGNLALGGGLEGGVLDVKGTTSQSGAVQNFGALTLNAGINRITRNDASSNTIVRINAITVNQRGTLDINAAANTSNFVQTDRFNQGGATGILGGWATVSQTDWAQNSTNLVDAFIRAVPTYVNNTWAAGNNTNITANTSVANGTTTSLRYNTSTGTTLQLTGTNLLEANGILQTANVAGASNIITGGSLKPSNTRDGANLYVHQYSTQGALTIESAIQNADNINFTFDTIGSVATPTVPTSTIRINAANAQNFYVGQTITGNFVDSLGNAFTTATISQTSITNPGLIDPSTGVVLPTGSATALILLNRVVAPTAPVTNNATASGASNFIKVGDGLVTLKGANTYTGPTLIASGTLSVNSIANGDVASPLGQSSNAAGNVVFAGSTLQYTGVSATTDRGMTLNDFGTLDISQPGAELTIKGNLAGAGKLVKKGAGSLILDSGVTVTPATSTTPAVTTQVGGATGLTDIEVTEGKLVLQYNNPNTTGNNRFAASTAGLKLEGGSLHLKGLDDVPNPSGTSGVQISENRSQQFLGQFTVGVGASEIKVTNGNNTLTTLVLQDPNATNPVNRVPGGTTHFITETVPSTILAGGNFESRIFMGSDILGLNTPLFWATFQNRSSLEEWGGTEVKYQRDYGLRVENFAKSQDVAASNVPGVGNNNRIKQIQAAGKETVGSDWVGFGYGAVIDEFGIGQSIAETFITTEGVISGVSTLNRTLPTTRNGNEAWFNVSNALLYETHQDSTLIVPETGSGPQQDVLLLTGGAILNSSMTGNYSKRIQGGKLMSGSLGQDGKHEFIIHNWNPAALLDGNSSVLEIGSNISNYSIDLDGPDGPEVANTPIMTHFTHVGNGTTLLDGNNSYTGTTFLNGGVLRIRGANALGTGLLRMDSGVLGLENDFTRALGTGNGQVTFGGSGGFTAYGAGRNVNLGGAAAQVKWGSNSFVPESTALLLSSQDATGKVTFVNPIDLGLVTRTIEVRDARDASVTVEAELSGLISGSGGQIEKTGYGTLAITGSANTFSGGISLAQGKVQVSAGSMGTGDISIANSSATRKTDVLNFEITGDATLARLNVGNQNAQGYSSLVSNGNLQFTQGGKLDGLLNIEVGSANQVAVNGNLTGTNGAIQLSGGGKLILNGTSGMQAGSAGEAINIYQSTLIRNGTVIAGSSGALGGSVVELGDIQQALASAITVDRATGGQSMIAGGYWEPENPNLNDGEGTRNQRDAFVFEGRDSIVIDGKEYTPADQSTKILVNGEVDHPERNGIYEINFLTTATGIKITSLVRTTQFDQVNKFKYGERITVTNGSAAGQTLTLITTPTVPDTSPLIFVKAPTSTAAINVALLAANNGTTLQNAVDINYALGTNYKLGGADTMTSGSAIFNGTVTLQKLTGTQNAMLQLVSSTSTGNGISIRGRISEVDTADKLGVLKTGGGTVSLFGANTYKGGTTVSAGTLLVNNLAGSGTGTGEVKLQGQGTTLGGSGIIAGTTTIGVGGILSPGDPLVNNGQGTLEFLKALTLKDNTQVLFTLGSENSFDRLVTRGALSVAPSTRLEILLDFIPTESLSWDILDWASTSSNLLSSLELPTLAQSALYWDISAFNSSGTINLAEITATTIPPARFAIRDADVAEDAVRVEVAVQLQWASIKSVTVPLSVKTGTGFATNSATGDVIISPSSVTFAPGETSKVVAINIRDDQAAESTEKLEVNLKKTATNALAAQSTFNLTIRDNDPVQLGSAWKVVNPVATNETVRDMAYNGTNQYLAVGTCGLLMTSPDGTTWTSKWTGVSLDLNAVVWFQNRWVAAGSSGITLSSADGENWTIGSIGQSAAVNDLLVSGTTLVAVGDNGVAATTTTAAVWTTQATGIITDIHSVAKNGTLLVAVGENMKALVSADNGTTWTVADVLASSTLSLRGITAHSAGFIAVGDSGSIYNGAVSGSTVTWTAATSGVTAVLNAVHSNGTAIVAVGNTGSAIRSTNGTTWAPVTVSVTSNLEHVGQGSTATTWLAGGAAGVILSSADSTTWTRVGSGSTLPLADVIYAGSQYVAIGANGQVFTSATGDSWTAGATGSSQQLNSLAYNPTGTLLVAVGNAGSIYTSTNGTSWTAATSGVSQDLNRVAFGGGNFIAVGEAGTILTSTNGTTWIDRSSSAPQPVNLGGVAYSPTLWMAVGDAGAAFKSADAGVSWTDASITSGADFNAVAWTSTHFVAVGDAGSIAVSTNGVSWTLPSADTPVDLHNVYYFTSGSIAARTVAVGADGAVTVSAGSTAATWARQLSRTCRELKGIAANATDLVAVGEDGSIIKSFTPSVGASQLGFVVSSMSASERSGTVNAIVRLSPSSSSPVTATFTVTAGTATVATDYKVLTKGTTLTFKPGDTELPIAIQLVDDAVVETDETLTITLSNITPATVTSSGISSLPLTIENDDAVLAYTPATLANQILPVGSPLTLSYNVTGSTPLTTQWLKNGKTVKGALSSTLSLLALSIADGAAYSLKMTNNVNPTGPAVAVTPTEIAVVDTAARLILVKPNTKAVLTQAAGGNGLTYQWQRTGGGGSTASTPTLTIPSVPGDVSQTGEYICTVTGPGGTLAGGPVRLAVARIPVIVDNNTSNTTITTGVLPAANVGKPYTAQVFTNSPTFNSLDVDGFSSGYATSYTATGLPAGLSINKVTGQITGIPTVATVSPAKVKVKATNIAGTSAEVIFDLTVNALATNVVGKFIGLFPRDPVITKGLGARLTLTTTAKGTFTGDLTIGFQKTSFKGNLIDFDLTQTKRTCSVVVTPKVAKGKKPTPITINMVLDPATNLMAADMSVGTVPTVTTVSLIKGWRAIFSKTVPSALLAGQHNVVLKIPSTTVIDDFVPAGHSYAGLNLAKVGKGASALNASGVVTISGKTADGASKGANLIGTTDLGPNGEVLFYHSLYGSKSNTASTGSFMGIASIAAGGAQEVTTTTTAALGKVTWSRPVQPRSAKLRNYPSGFVGALELDLSGGRYVAPVKQKAPLPSFIILGGSAVPATSTSVAADITFTGAGIDDSTEDPNRSFDIKPTTTVSFGVTNDTKMKVTFNATTGTFTGSYTIVEDTTLVKRTVNFFGLVVPDLSTPTTLDWDGIGYGHFMLEQLPDPKTGLILSGQVEIKRAPTPPVGP